MKDRLIPVVPQYNPAYKAGRGQAATWAGDTSDSHRWTDDRASSITSSARSRSATIAYGPAGAGPNRSRS